MFEGKSLNGKGNNNMGTNNNLFTIPTKGTTNHITDFVKLEAGEQAREILLTNIGKNVNGKSITALDLFNIKGLKSDFEIEQVINNYLSKEGREPIDINTEKGLKRVNNLLEESIRIYEDIFYRKYPNRKFKTKFESKQEVIDFLKLTLKGDVKAEIACFISKISLAVNEIIEDPTLNNLENKSKYFIREEITPGIQVIDYKFFKTFGISNGRITINHKDIDFRIRYRGKKSDKSVLKMINDPDYSYSELIKDEIGIEFEVESEESAFMLLNHFVEQLFIDLKPNGEVINSINLFKNKNLLTKKGFNKLVKKGYNFNPYFKKYIEENIENNGREIKNNRNYQDAKFEGNVKIPKDPNIKDSQLENHSVELRVVYVGNKNEEGLSDHRILDMLKVIFGIIRCSGYIRENEIKKIINILLENNPDLIDKKGLTKDIIYKYYIEEKLFKVKSGKSTMYTTKCRHETLSGTDIYPDSIKKG